MDGIADDGGWGDLRGNDGSEQTVVIGFLLQEYL